MAFDFPASPSQGQVYAPTGGPAYQWDGEKWKGGQPSGPQTEQLFDASGLGNVDIAVPSWAVGADLTMSLVPTATVAWIMRVSFDGTTFLAGASDYTNSAPGHDTAAGTPFNTTIATAGAYLQLSQAGDVLTFPAVVNSSVLLRRGATTNVFSAKSRSVTNHTSSGHRTHWFTGQVTVAAAAGALQVKALRIMNHLGTGTLFGPGSWIRVKWLGDAAQVPISNAIADAPNNGKPWVRRNGVWIPQTGVVQQKLTAGYTDFTRSVTTEAMFADIHNFSPLYPDSKVLWQFSAYAVVSTTAAVDDLRGRLFGKYYDSVGLAYTGAVAVTIFGHVNMGGAAASSVFYPGQVQGSPVDVSTLRRADNGTIYMRLAGMPDYASVTLDCYEHFMLWTEILE